MATEEQKRAFRSFAGETPVGRIVETVSVEDEEAPTATKKPKNFTNSELVTMGLLTALPALIGGLAGGAEGAAAGGQATMVGAKTILDQKNKETEDERKAEEKKLATMERNRYKEQELALRKQGLDQTRMLAQMNYDERLDRRKEADLQKLEAKTAPLQAAITNLGLIEDELGFKIDDAVAQDGKLLVKGKEVDLPGVNIPGIGRTTLATTRARNLRSATERLFNVELKDRSGAAVTTPELERLKQEFSEGRFNTEPELIRALQRYKKAAAAAIAAREAGFRPEVLKEFQERGGISSEVLSKGQPSASQGKQVVRTGRTKDGRQVVEYSDGTREIR